jgi:hypothetical protein
MIWHETIGVNDERLARGRGVKYFHGPPRECLVVVEGAKSLVTAERDEEWAAAVVIRGRQPDIFPLKVHDGCVLVAAGR